MKYQISKAGNYLKVTNIDRKEDFYGLLKDVFIDKNNLGKGNYKIYNVLDLENGTLLEIGELYKLDNTLYTINEFDTFYTEMSESLSVNLPTGASTSTNQVLANTKLDSIITNTGASLTDSQLRATPLPISPRPNTTGANGTTAYKLISLASTNANVVKASGGNLYSLIAIGLTSNVRYLKLYNKATTPVVGTDIPVMAIPIPTNSQGAGVAIPFSMGVNFTLGIGIAITAGLADNNTTAVLANDVVVNLTFA